MTKVEIQKVFDTAQIATTRAYTELTPFFDYFGPLVDNLVRILRKGIGLRDNIDCDVVRVEVAHDTLFKQQVKSKPVGIIAVDSDLPLARPLFWGPDQANSALIAITATFVTPMQGNNQPTKAFITFIVFYS